MLQRYRVFAAMLGFDDFTVADLVQASGANARTVRTTLSRNSDLLEEVGRDETGRRGGSWIRYRLRPEGAKELRQRLAEVERLSLSEALPTSPSELLAAEHLLLERLPDEPDPDVRASLVRRGRRLLAAGRQAIESASDVLVRRDAEAHGYAVDLLLQLAEAEDRRLRDPAAATALWREMVGELQENEDELRSVKTTSSLHVDLRRRLLESPVAESRDHGRMTEGFADHLEAQVTSALSRFANERAPLSEATRSALAALARGDSSIPALAVLARSLDADIVIKASPSAGSPHVREVWPAPDCVSRFDVQDSEIVVSAAPAGTLQLVGGVEKTPHATTDESNRVIDRLIENRALAIARCQYSQRLSSLARTARGSGMANVEPLAPERVLTFPERVLTFGAVKKYSKPDPSQHALTHSGHPLQGDRAARAKTVLERVVAKQKA